MKSYINVLAIMVVAIVISAIMFFVWERKKGEVDDDDYDDYITTIRPKKERVQFSVGRSVGYGKTRCFDCERQDGHRANPSRCFTCERQSGQRGNPSRCFSCE